ncbi:g137 [Coccomyxa viridis]|uniref:G137 protein n=1 Tax=Coccomyxa viridis TaxID=1274662 RepID=A0ABP1FGN1_9CHLO
MGAPAHSGKRLLAPTPEDAKTVQLIAAYTGSADHVETSLSKNDVEYIDESGRALFGSNTICRHLARSSPHSKALLGADVETAAVVSQWMSMRYSLLLPISEEALRTLESHLATRTFILGTTLSLADLTLFGALHQAVANFPPAQLRRFRSIVRWFDYLQHVADKTGIFKPVAFQIPEPDLKPPTIPPPKAKGEAAKEAASSAKAGADVAPGAAAVAASPADPSAPADAAKKDKKKEKKEKAKGGEAKPAVASKDEPRVDQLDIRVGQIVKIGPHPDADSLYVEEIDLGEGQPRQIVSGLVKFVPVEKMENRRVVVVCNLKPAKMRGVLSSGMVLCASNAAHDEVDPINPPEGVPVGERITFEGYANEPDAQLNPKKNIFGKLAPDLLTNTEGVANYKGVPFMTSRGPVTASIPNAMVA